MCVIMAAYGGLHMPAWKAFFPTSIERLLWRISSILIAAFCSIYYSFLAITIIKTSLKAARVLFYVLFCPVAVAIVFYLVAGAFVVIETFINLRRLLLEVYCTRLTDL